MYLKQLGLCLATVVAFGCGNDGSIGDGADGGGPSITALTLSPPNATIEVVNGAAAPVAYTITAEYVDGTTEDVSASALISVDNVRLGSFASARFTANGSAGGRGTVTATYQGAMAQGQLAVYVRDRVVIDPAPADAGALFDAAAEEPGLAPALVYPADETMVPPNLGDFDVHWTDNAGADLFQVTLRSEFFELDTYVSGTPNASSWIAIAPELWSVAAASDRAAGLTVTVRGMASAAPETAGTSSDITTYIAGQAIKGGIYYWAATSLDGPDGIYRHDMGAAGQPAERFFTRDESPNNRCVACHALSRDGTRMALTFDGGNGTSTILDVATRTPLVAVDDPAIAWNFAVFEPDSDRILTVSHGVLTLRSAVDASVLATVSTMGYATHPDFRPQSDAIVYVSAGVPGQDWHFTGGNIVTQSYDRNTSTFGDPMVLVQGDGNNYYPSYSPDGQWVLFNRSSEDAYDDGTAELWVVKADGSQPPMRLDLPNIGPGYTNSWGRWAPFSQTYGDAGEPFYWFTFSTKRNFGVRLVGANRPQIWMAPFFPNRAQAGEPASAAAFRLPAQDITGGNHIAQWTEEFIVVE